MKIGKCSHCGHNNVDCSANYFVEMLRSSTGRKSPPMAPTEEAGTNPKDLIGAVKLSITKLPPVALLHFAHGFADGAVKYGPYNWRDKKVIASIYVDAMLRHVLAWWDGERVAPDSQVHHLGHAGSCLAILLDAEASDQLVDDRPQRGGGFTEELARINQLLKESRCST